LFFLVPHRFQQEANDGVDFEQALQTQRDALLRLLAGLFVAVAVISVAPIAPAWSRRVRSFVYSVLQRAEAAGQCLVLAQAYILARDHGGPQGLVRPPSRDPVEAPCFDADDLPSLAELRCRMNALRALLRNLPRSGRRLLGRMRKRSTPVASALLDRHGWPDAENVETFTPHQWCAPGLWHPPETTFAVV